MINVRLSIIPGISSAFALEDGSSIETLLNIAEENGFDSVISDGEVINGYEVNVIGNTGSSSILRDGDRVVITKMIKGNVNSVIVAKIPGAIKEISVEDGATVADALRIAEVGDYEGHEIKDLNGNDVPPSSALVFPTSGAKARLTITKKVKGNVNSVIVAKIPGPIKEISVEDGATVADALRIAEVGDYEGHEIKDLNGNDVPLSSALVFPTSGAKARLTITKKVKGNDLV